MRIPALLILAAIASGQAAEPATGKDHEKKDRPEAVAKHDRHTMPPEMKDCIAAWADWEALSHARQAKNPKGGQLSPEDAAIASAATERVKATQKAALIAYFKTADLTPVPAPKDRSTREGKAEAARIDELNQAMGAVAAALSNPAADLQPFQRACAAYAKHYNVPELMDAMNQGPEAQKRHEAQGRGKPSDKAKR
jgi:hypothetical protein